MWALVLTVFSGLALLSGQHSGSDDADTAPVIIAMAASTTAGARQAGSPAAATLGSPAHAPTAPPNAEPTEPTDTEPTDTEPSDAEPSDCKTYGEVRDYLPLNRWTSFELFVVDNARFIQTRAFMSMLASFLFMAAALAWRIIGMAMGFSYSFDMVCLAAPSINSAARTFALYASWFLIPAWLFVLAAAARRWNGGKRKGGPAAAMRMLTAFLAATGLIFFIADQSDEPSNPTGAYTVPWMARTVQDWFGRASESLLDLSNLADLSRRREESNVFYDHDAAVAGKATCAALEKALYDKYRADNASTGFDEGVAAMDQVSRMWETTLVRSWMLAQFGDGSAKNPSPAHAACRLLEARADVDVTQKLAAYDLSIGQAPGTTTPEMRRGVAITARTGEQTLIVAWGACRSDSGLGGGQPLPQWDGTGMSGMSEACEFLYSSDGLGMTFGEFVDVLLDTALPGQTSGEGLGAFYFNGDDELNDKLGECVMTSEECRANWAFVASWLGGNEAERISQGLMSLIIAAIFLFVLGPLSIGLTLVSVALAGLAMILPISLIMFAARLEQGKRLLKFTGAAAAGKFVLTLALTAMLMLIVVTTGAIRAAIGTDTPSFFEQIAEAAAPLAALWLFKKVTKTMGLGNITSINGAVGFAGAAALKAAGDGPASRNVADRASTAPAEGLAAFKRGFGTLNERFLKHSGTADGTTDGQADTAKDKPDSADTAKDKPGSADTAKGGTQGFTTQPTSSRAPDDGPISAEQRAAAYLKVLERMDGPSPRGGTNGPDPDEGGTPPGPAWVGHASLSEIRDMKNAPARLPDGRPTTAGMIGEELDHAFGAMEDVAERMRRLFEQWDRLPPEEVRTRRDRLVAEHGANVERIDGLTTSLRDSLLASMSARSLVDMRTDELSRPGGARNTGERLKNLHDQRTRMNELFDRGIGALSVVPGDAGAAEKLGTSVQEFRSAVATLIRNEYFANQDSVRLHDEAQRIADEVRRTRESDPRQSATPNSRAMLKRMYRQE
ncbi:hypothetical protein Acsp03_58350 [Actinomadura sp. NBRC 104412]|uniref:hypothetical protein n=1 Tax=Actinomadura sp. NBRC 104412 TaxID=3032203 RepID=UPI0024A32F21|nr:hypothetical protein [Actinomadura sp. NBRC 104412]GLZ08369.1 hypothetical protein Acsp03_58350 [Actinomadura sp. NBRC 104412]